MMFLSVPTRNREIPVRVSYNMATLGLELALFALFSSVKTGTNGHIITAQVELHTTVDFPCNCTICPESTTGVQWYRSSNKDFFIKDGKAVAWWSEGTTGSSQGFGIKDDFSMIIYNLTDQHDQDLYRCVVFPAGGAAQCTHDVKLGIFANPNSSPVIEYIRQTNGFNVTCSISNVFPMTFPILKTKEGKKTAYNNSDGSYNTTVTHWFPAKEKDGTIGCLYSNLNFKGIASLRIVNSCTIDQPEEEDMMEKNMTHDTCKTECRPKPSGLWMIWIILITEVLFLIGIVYAIKTGRVLLNSALCNEHHRENSKEEEPAKSTRNLLFGKLSCAVITLTIQITVLILLVTYLATTTCFN